MLNLKRIITLPPTIVTTSNIAQSKRRKLTERLLVRHDQSQCHKVFAVLLTLAGIVSTKTEEVLDNE